jgi:hypothetical protein
MIFSDIVHSADELMGAKAVWGRIGAPVMSFSGSGSSEKAAYYQKAKSVAERSLSSPYFIAIGGGQQVSSELKGRVLGVVKPSLAYGKTQAMLSDELGKQLEQWPVSIQLLQSWNIVSEPDLVKDLKFANYKILNSAFDTVLRNPDFWPQIWEALKNEEVVENTLGKAPIGFKNPSKPSLYTTFAPKISSTTPEGKSIWILSRKRERSHEVRKEALKLNKSANYGVYSCAACRVSNTNSRLFDVHHINPIAVGERSTSLNDVIVLCPNCHRWCHAMADDKLFPVPVTEIQTYQSS